MDHVIIRPGELALKGKNRHCFEDRLFENLRAVLAQFEKGRVERRWGRFYIGPTQNAVQLAKATARVFGVVHTSPAKRVPTDYDQIAEVALVLTEQALAAMGTHEAVPFRVRVKRSDKSFPMNSMETAKALGALLLERFDMLFVKLEQPRLTIHVEIRQEGSFLFLEKIQGAGGLPLGSEGRVLSLLSGGIDSPVSSWLMMKRGCRVDFVHFHSQLFTGPGSLEKARALLRVLDSWQGRSRMWVVPFSEIQKATKELPRPGYRTLLYRRFMTRIAERLAVTSDCQALVTGDSLGQVASQTLPNIRVVDAASETLPILRPLLGFDKQETIALARKIGSYEISIRPFEDCCTLFQPEHPQTRGKAAVAAEIEANCDWQGLIADAVLRSECEEAAPKSIAQP